MFLYAITLSEEANAWFRTIARSQNKRPLNASKVSLVEKQALSLVLGVGQ